MRLSPRLKKWCGLEDSVFHVQQIVCLDDLLPVFLPARVGFHGASALIPVFKAVELPQMNDLTKIPNIRIEKSEWLTQIVAL